MISVTGEPGGHGVRCGVSIADMTAGMYAAFGIMLALRVKERTGRGPVHRRLHAGGPTLAARHDDRRLSGRWRPRLSPWAPRTRHSFPIRPSARRRATWRWRSAARSCGRCSARYRLPRAGRRSALSHQRRPGAESRQLIAETPGRLPDPDLRGMGADPARERHPDGRNQQHRASGRSPPGRGPRRTRRNGSPARRQGADGGSAGEASPRRPDRCGRRRPMLGEHTDQVLVDLLGLDAAQVAALRATGVIGPKR